MPVQPKATMLCKRNRSTINWFLTNENIVKLSRKRRLFRQWFISASFSLTDHQSLLSKDQYTEVQKKKRSIHRVTDHVMWWQMFVQEITPIATSGWPVKPWNCVSKFLLLLTRSIISCLHCNAAGHRISELTMHIKRRWSVQWPGEGLIVTAHKDTVTKSLSHEGNLMMAMASEAASCK